MNGSIDIPPVIGMLTVSIFIYSIAIAWFKDVPDMEGDRRFQIRTLTLQLGARNVLCIGNSLLGLLFMANAALALNGVLGVNKWIFAVGYLLMLCALGAAAARLQLNEPASVRRYYLFIWVLFFAEYAVFAMGRSF
jgi:homogentisate phytyltransferase/homogentisate geranylgeranyltransferase